MDNPIIKRDIFIPDEREPYYEQLARIQPHLHVPIPQAFLETQIWNKNGHTLHHAQRRTQSWNRNAYNHALCIFGFKNADDSTFTGGKLSFKDTGGTIRHGEIPGRLVSSSDADSSGDGVLAEAAVSSFGILVGDDNTAVTFEDYVLGSKIAHGEGAGQLSYSDMQTQDENYVGGSLTYTITHARYFNNNESGEGSISVEEACFVCNGYVTASGQKFLLSRDLTGSLSVPYQGQLKVSYAISLVFSA
jgi:hypothetical protein